ncbi:hypothetical protein QE152_g22371 [Popillia japonica]|uniref:DUF4709 domain-containing protein n=1 Tax=Popillia japonica TaxID=7064 RepID=A0AAW1KL10_POPJA
MNEIPALTIDFKKINAFTSERDLKLWKQQATAKYCKSSYEEIRKQNEILDKKINKCEQSIKETEEEIPKLKALNERMVASIRTASTATNYLIQLGIYVENDIVTVKDRYEKLINKYSDMYKNKKKLLQGSNILYKELELIRNNTEKKRIEKDVIYRFIEDQEKMIKIKENLNKQLLNSEIIKFVQAVISRKKSDIIEKQLAEQREIAQDLVKMYEKQQQKAERSLLQNAAKGNELPKLSMGVTGIQELAMFKIPKILSVEVPQTKLDKNSKNEELNLLNELKHRSNQRKKIIQQKTQENNTTKANRLANIKNEEITRTMPEQN